MGIKSKKLEYFPSGNTSIHWYYPIDEDGNIDDSVIIGAVARITIVPDDNGITDLSLSIQKTGWTSSDTSTHAYCLITTTQNEYINGHLGTSDYEFMYQTDEQGNTLYRQPAICNIRQNMIPGKSYYIWIFLDGITQMDGAVALLDGATGSGTYLALSTASSTGGFFGQTVSVNVTQVRDKSVSTQVFLKYTGGGQSISNSIYGPKKAEGTYVASFTADLETYAQLFPNSITGTFTLETVTKDASTGNTIGTTTSTVTLTFRSDDVKPVLSSGWAAISPYNPGLDSAIAGYYLRSKSNVQASFDSSKVTYRYGASFSSFSIVYDDEETNASPYVSSKSVNTSQTAVCKVTDSRGAYATAELPFTITDYFTPSTNNEIERCDTTGVEDEDANKFFVITTPNYASIDGKNTVTISVNYRVATGAYNPSKAVTIVNNDNPTSGAIAPVSGRSDGKNILPSSEAVSPDEDYEISVTITDLAGSSSTVTYVLSARNWAMKFNETGTAVGFGMAPIDDKTLQIPADWEIRVGLKSLVTKMFDEIYPVGSIYMSTSATNPHYLFGGAWERIKDRFLLGASSTYTAGTEGGEATHELTDNELPVTQLSLSAEFDGAAQKLMFYKTSAAGGSGWDLVTYGNNGTADIEIDSFGGGAAHNNMPPFVSVYMWKRMQIKPEDWFIEGYYLTTSGSTVNFNAPTTYSTFGYAVIECSPGDMFTLYGYGGSASRVWAFAKGVPVEDGKYDIISRAGKSIKITEDDSFTIEAPAEAKYLIVNSRLSSDHGVYRID